MTLIVENGSGVANANSYLDAPSFKALATARGETAAAALTDAAVEILLVKAMDYLSQFTDRWRGSKANATYALPWPRSNVYLYGVALDADVIPNELVMAQYELALAANSVDLMPTTGVGGFVVMEKIGPLETRWSEGAGERTVPTLRRVDMWLTPLIASYGQLTNYRI